MPKLSDLKVTIGLAGVRTLNKQLRDVKGKFRRNFGHIAKAAKNLALTIGTTIGGAMALMIKQGAQMETLRTGFISITGSANKAAAVVAELNEFAAETPFQLDDISSAARKLLATGSRRSDLTKELKFLGDVAASSGNSINDIAAIFTKVRAKGKVELENLNQLAERNIPIFDELRKVTGDANMEFGAGAVSVEEFTDALRGMAEEGGIAEDAMVNLSQTVEGRMTTLMDNLKQEMAGFAERSGITDAFGGVLKDATEALKGVSGVTQTDVAAALGKAEEAMEAFGGVTTANVGDVEDIMLDAGESIRRLQKELEAGTQKRVGMATLFGGIGGGKEALAAQVEQFKALQTVLDSLSDAHSELNNAILEGNVPEQTANVDSNTASTESNAKAKKELVAVEQSYIEKLGNVKQLVSDTAVNTLAAAHATHQLKTSMISLNMSVEPVRNELQELGAFAMNELPGFFEGAFSALKEGTQSFGQFMLQTLQRLLLKAAALAATFAALSALLGGPTGVAAMTGGKAGFGHFLAGGFGIQGFAAGGLVTGPTMALVGEGAGTSLSNPEVIAPLDKLQQMLGGGMTQIYGRLDGRDILLSSERAGFDRNRVRGF